MFIPVRELEGLANGCRVRLNKNLDLMAGCFTAGHEFVITGESERGFDIKDSEGRTACEVPSDYFIRLDYKKD